MQGNIHKRVKTCKNGRVSTLWYVVVDLPRRVDGKRRQKWHGGYRTKRAAEAVRARLIHELSTGFYVEPSTMCFNEWLLEVLDADCRDSSKAVNGPLLQRCDPQSHSTRARGHTSGEPEATDVSQPVPTSPPIREHPDRRGSGRLFRTRHPLCDQEVA